MKIPQTNLLLTTLLIVIYLINGWQGYWWINLIIGFASGYIFYTSPGRSFMIHFLIIFISWTVLSFIKDQQVNQAVSGFLSSLAGNIPYYFLYLCTGLAGGLVTGWAASLGSQLRKIVQ